jgi:hypothetical protein
MGGKLTDYVHSEQIAQEQNQKIKMTRFIMILRRYIR